MTSTAAGSYWCEEMHLLGILENLPISFLAKRQTTPDKMLNC